MRPRKYRVELTKAERIHIILITKDAKQDLKHLH